MTDAERYEAHKDDEGEWEEVPAPKRRRSEKRRLDSIVSVRFTAAEVDEVRRRAALMGMSMSGYLRWRALSARSQTYSNVNPATITITGTAVLLYPEAS